mgnify:FL=1
MIVKHLEEKKSKIAVIGLGYVGLPIALAFSKKLSVIGFDLNKRRIEMLNKGEDPSMQMEKADFENSDIVFTDDYEELKKANFYIIAVPTPVDEHKVPDISLLLLACSTIGRVIKPGDYVIFESTVYPGCTEEDCIPVIEEMSGLKFVKDFKVGYSPERINPGDKQHLLHNVIKIVSGCDEESLDNIATIYCKVVEAGVHKASSIKVAEAAKVIENSQRDINIALMNELSIIFDKMNINTYEVLEAAGTKWNFLNFQPGLVGGHCIGVDPYYLTYKAEALGFTSNVILAGRQINDGMGTHIAEKVLQHIAKNSNNIHESKVLIMGATFKENVPDIRNCKVFDIVKSLQTYHMNVHVADPLASSEEVEEEYGISLTEELAKDYDAVVLAVQHDQYKDLSPEYFRSITKENALLVDVKGIFRRIETGRQYWSL